MNGGVKGYERFRRKCEQDKRQVHRSAKESKNVRYLKQLMGKTTWFRKEKEDSDKDDVTESGEVTAEKVEKRFEVRNKNENGKVVNKNQVMKTKTVLFVEKTEKGELASRLRKLETRLSDVTGYRIKIVEKGGRTASRPLLGLSMKGIE